MTFDQRLRAIELHAEEIVGAKSSRRNMLGVDKDQQCG